MLAAAISFGMEYTFVRNSRVAITREPFNHRVLAYVLRNYLASREPHEYVFIFVPLAAKVLRIPVSFAGRAD